jgi:hypothetical protein
MKNKKGNITIMAIIIVVVAITAGVIGWLIGLDRMGINEFSVSSDRNGQLNWSGIADVKSSETVHFRLIAKDVDYCNITGGNLFDPKSNLPIKEIDIKKQVDDFSGGTYTLVCARKGENKTVSKNITINVTPINKLVMCMEKCGSGGTPLAKDMNRYLGETVQKIRACFGSYSADCPSQDVTERANWTSSNSDVAYWTRDLIYPEKTFENVYPKNTFITDSAGISVVKAEHKGYTYSVNVTGKMAGQ